jgi:hypothetical protein
LSWQNAEFFNLSLNQGGARIKLDSREIPVEGHFDNGL